MLAWVGGSLLVAAACVIGRWALNRTDALGRLRDFPWVSVVVLALAALAALVPWVRRVQLERRLEAAASQIVGAQVDVSCQGFGEAFVDVGVEYGYVPSGPDGVPERRTLIKRDQCGDLRAYLASDKETPTPEQVVAVHTLTHEAIHMSGVTSESETECLAVQRDPAMAEALGASPEGARRLALLYWTAVYPRMPANYRKDDCPGVQS